MMGLMKRLAGSVDLLRRRPVWPGDSARFDYQKKFNDFDLPPGEAVLDIGSGGYPFPYATVLTDRYRGPTHHRFSSLVTEAKPFVQSAIERLPFASKSFGYVYCSHVLEHVEDPLLACSEIVRVGKRGYIETPTIAKDMLFAWAKDMHKWHLVRIANRLIFFEYSARQLEGVRSEVWNELIFSSRFHPLQELFYSNQDMFNVMFSWQDGFECAVYYLNGHMEQQTLH